MLLSEKMRQTKFSPSEKQVIDLILAHPDKLAELTVKELAQAAYVNPSILIRVAKKLDFSGWVELKAAFLEEQAYLENHFTEVDANLPFTPSDNLMAIAAKMAKLEQTTIDDSCSLLDHDSLRKATNLLQRAEHIRIFGGNANLLLSQDFALKMNRLGKQVAVSDITGEAFYEAYNLKENDCALLISYTGEQSYILKMAALLREHNVKILALTSIGDNQLAALADHTLRLTTRERLYSKIGNFTINTSISYLLDVLYSCVFAEEYQRNLNHLIQMGEKIDHRSTSSEIMAEGKNEFPFLFSDLFPN